MSERPTDLLQRVFGYSRFRGHQQAIVEQLVSGQDALVLMPTGGGKSLCYQIPSLLREGVGIVVSPLIALIDFFGADTGIPAGTFTWTLHANGLFQIS